MEAINSTCVYKNSKNEILKSFLFAEENGIKSLSLHSSENNFKKPTESKWSKDVNNAFNLAKKENIGIGYICGSVSDITVIDLDVVKDNDSDKISGIDWYEEVARKNNFDPYSIPFVKTPSGGIHLYLCKYYSELSTSTGLKDKDGKYYKVDIRNNGGYVVAPPTINPSNGKKYEWGIDFNRNLDTNISDIIVAEYFKTKNFKSKKITEVVSTEEIYNNIGINRKNITNTPKELFIELLDLITPNYWSARDSWRDLVWIISNLFNNSEEGRLLAINYSKKTVWHNFDEDEVEKLYDTANPELLGYSRLLEICKLVNEEATNKIIDKYSPKIERKHYFEKYTFDDFRKETSYLFPSYESMLIKLQNTLSKCAVYIAGRKVFLVNFNAHILTCDKLPLCPIKYNNERKKIKTLDIQDILKKEIYTIINCFDDICCTPNYDINSNKFNVFSPNISIPDDSAGNIFMILEFFRTIICDNDENCYEYLLQWMKKLIDYKRTNVAILLYSNEQGTGKSTFQTFLSEFVVGSKNSYNASTLGNVLGTHANLANKFLVHVDEVSSSKDLFLHNLDKLKTYITSKTIEVNEKFKPIYSVENLTNWVLSSNNLDCLRITEFDRRYFCLAVSNKYSSKNKDSNLYWEEFYQKCMNQETANSLVYYLNSIEYKYIKLPETKMKEKMIDAHLPSNERFYKDHLEEDISTRMQGSYLYDIYKNYCIQNGYRDIKTRQVFGMSLSEHFPNSKKRTKNFIVYLLKLKNTEELKNLPLEYKF